MTVVGGGGKAHSLGMVPHVRSAAMASTAALVGPRITVAVAGLGAIGLSIVRALDQSPGDFDLIAVSSRDSAKAKALVADFRSLPTIVRCDELGCADVVVEAAPASAFAAIAEPVVDAGRTLVVSSAGALLDRLDLVERAREKGGRIVVATGAILGLDAVRAAALGPISSIRLETRKSPKAFIGAPYLEAAGVSLDGIAGPRRIFSGSAVEAARAFPANANVAAALALAGVGSDKTEVEIWADPAVSRNIHRIYVESDAATLNMTVETAPSDVNPRTGKLAPLSVLACLRSLSSTLKVGT